MTEKLHVLTIIRHPVGGIRTYLKYTYGYLDRQKYKITICTVQDPEGQLILDDLRGFDLTLYQVKGKWLLGKLVWRIFRILINKKVDLIHSQGYTAGILGVLGNWLTRKKHILTSHDVLREDQFKGPKGWINKRIIGLLLTKLDIIQSVSFDAQQNIVDFYPKLKRYQDKLTVILNGIAVSQLEENSNEVSKLSCLQQIDFKKNTLLFGFLGRFMPQKGFEYLIDAVEKLSKATDMCQRFQILVVNDGAFIREYKHLIEEKSLSHYFTFVGFVPEVGRILKKLDALVIPSLWEAYGLIAAEAFILGCPVIASNCIGLREVIRNTPARVVQSGNSASLSAAMREFMDNPEPFKHRATDFIAEARLRFDSRKTAKQLDALLDKVIKSR